MQIVYRKSDLVCVGTVALGMTVGQEITLNVIPNFGGVPGDYEVIETNEQNIHLELIGGVVTVVKNDPPVATEPVDEEKVMLAEAIIAQSVEIEELKARLTAANL